MTKVINMSDYKTLEDLVRERLDAKTIVIAGVLSDDTSRVYIDPDMTDIDLVYLIQTLQDLRARRLNAVNS